MPQISYPAPLYTPQGIAGATLTLNTNVGTIKYVFNAAGTSATCTYNNGTPGTVTNASWTQEAYRGRLYAEQTNIVTIQTDCAFTTASSGVIKGTAYTASPTALTGTFTYTTP